MKNIYHSAGGGGSRKADIEFPIVHFTNSVKEVIATMTGMKIEETALQKESLKTTQVSGVVLLVGQKNMMISLVMSMDTAALLVSHMTETKQDKLQEEEICDGISELVHIISGAVRARLKEWKYDIAALCPFALVGDGHRMVHRHNVAEITRQYRIGENDIVLKVYFL